MADTGQVFYYDAESLQRGIEEFETAYRIDSDVFFEAYVAQDVPSHVPRFDAHVWASFIEDFRRLSGSGSTEPVEPMARVTRAFAYC